MKRGHGAKHQGGTQFLPFQVTQDGMHHSAVGQDGSWTTPLAAATTMLLRAAWVRG